MERHVTSVSVSLISPEDHRVEVQILLSESQSSMDGLYSDYMDYVMTTKVKTFIFFIETIIFNSKKKKSIDTILTTYEYTVHVCI